MYFAFNIAVYNSKNEEIRTAVIDLMADDSFSLVDTDLERQALQTPGEDLLEVDKRLMLRKLLIAPNKNKWSMIYPSTGWFSEVQDLGIKLSKRLDCVVMALLVDNSYGWGYELFQKGQVVDRFHTNPLSSPTLSEKRQYGLQNEDQAKDMNQDKSQEQSINISTLAKLSLPTPERVVELKNDLLKQQSTNLLTPEQKSELEGKLNLILTKLSLPTSEQKADLLERYSIDPSIFSKLHELISKEVNEIEEYQGNPSVVADTFEVAEDIVAYYLSKQEGELHDKMVNFFKLLNIENGDGSYQDFLKEIDDDWYHLIFARYMTPIELQWREKWITTLPFVAPPLWLNEL